MTKGSHEGHHFYKEGSSTVVLSKVRSGQGSDKERDSPKVRGRLEIGQTLVTSNWGEKGNLKKKRERGTGLREKENSPEATTSSDRLTLGRPVKRRRGEKK